MGRLHKQSTLEVLTKSSELQKIVNLVVPESEFDDHDFGYGDMCSIIPIPDAVKGIAKTRQWIIDNSKTDFLMLLDDDLQFFKRLSDNVSLLSTTTEELEELFLQQLTWLSIDDIALTSISVRQYNRFVTEDYNEVTRQMTNHGINKPLFDKHGFRFDKVELMEDFHLTLDLLTSGFKNRVSHLYSSGQPASNLSGGCSTYRTAEKQKECAEILKSAHPNFVTVVEKQNQKSGWDGMKSRHDVRVQWAKAYASSQEEEI